MTTIEHATEHATEQQVTVTEAVKGIHRVVRDGTTVGYIQESGQRFVALRGPVYNTSVEVAQTQTLERALRRLLTT